MGRSLFFLLMLALLLLCGFASYQGWGTRQIGPERFQAEQRSVRGPAVIGRGPRTGK